MGMASIKNEKPHATCFRTNKFVWPNQAPVAWLSLKENNYYAVCNLLWASAGDDAESTTYGTISKKVQVLYKEISTTVLA